MSVAGAERKRQILLWKNYSESQSPKIYRILESKHVLKVAVGGRHTLFLTTEYELYAVGANNHRQLGIERCEMAPDPVLVTPLLGMGIRGISCGRTHSAAVTNQGELVCWGNSEFGQCGTKVFDRDSVTPTTVAFSDPGLMCTKCKTLVVKNDDTRIVDVACGDSHTIALADDSKLWGWGSSPQNGLRCRSSFPQVIEELIGAKVLSIAVGANHSAAICEKVRPSALSSQTSLSASNANLSESMKSSGPMTNQASPSRTSSTVSESGLYYSRVSAPCPSCNHTLLALNSSSVLDDCHDDNVFSLGASGMLVLDSPEHVSPEEGRRPSDGGGSDDEKGRASKLSSSDEDIGFASINDNYLGVEDDEQTFKSAISFNLEPESVRKFLDKGSVLDVNAHWKYLSPKPDERHRSRSTFNAECRDRAKLMVQDIAHRFDSRSCEMDKDEKQEDPERENTLSSGTNGRNADTRATRASMRRRKLTNPLQKTASIAQDTAEFLSNTGSSLIRVKDRMSSLTRRSTFLRRASLGSIGDEDGPGFAGSKHPGSYQRSTGKSTEVFTWGENDSYQLGVGDNKPRSAPTVIKALGHRNALKVCLGRKHSVVLTSNFQLVGFGSNEFGQLGHTAGSLNFLPNPDLLKDEGGKNIGGWDIAAGNNCTVLVADTGVTRKTTAAPSSTFYVESFGSGTFEVNPWDSQILYLGIISPAVEHSGVALVVNDPFESEKLAAAAGAGAASPALAATSNIPLESSETVEFTKTLKPYNWPLSNQLSPIEVWSGASDQTVVCRISQQQRKVLRILLKWAFAERNFFAHMRAIRDLIMKPFLTSDVFRSAVQPSFYGPSVTTLLNSFCDTVDQLGKICVLLIEDVQSECKLSDFLFVRDYQSYIDMFNKFLALFCDAHCIGSYEFCALSVAVSFFEKNKKCLCDLVGPVNSSGGGGGKEKEAPLHQLFYRLLERPINRISFYKEMLTKLADCLDSFVNEYTTVTKARDEWSNLWAYALEQKKQAEATRLYWDNTSIKISESLKHPKRRLIRDSKKSGLSLLGSNRFATHHFTLFSDMLVHQQFSNHEVFWLQTIWLESLKDGEASKKNCMKLTMPEEREFYLCASSASDKADWCIDLTKAIERALNPGSVPNIACEAQLDKTLSLCRTSKVREASHTFTSANSKLKGATYKGTWKNGKPHDKGMLVWPDGRTYIGDFSEGLQHGQGRLIVHSPPNGSDSSLQPLFEQSYEGQWQHGHMHGFGMLNYHNGDQYVGEFERSMRCGFGLLRVANPADGSHQGCRSRTAAPPLMHKQPDSLSISTLRPYHKSSVPDHINSYPTPRSQNSRPLSAISNPLTPENEFFPDFGQSLYQRQESQSRKISSPPRPLSENLSDKVIVGAENFGFRRKQESGSIASSEHGSYSSVAFAGEQFWEEKTVDSDGVSSNMTPDYNLATSSDEWKEDPQRDNGTFTHCHLSSEFLESSLYVENLSLFHRIFYGEWIDDKRHGYGVLEDLASNQRYIGMWLNDLKHGNGVTVCSQTGLYYEGTFVNGKLTGTGLLLTEDDTMYEGEMNGYTLNGKGILTFPHGDHIEGSFEGCWGAEDLKIRGVLKRYQSEPKTKPCGSLYRKFDVDASIKWEAVFRKCRRKMGVIRSMETDNDSPGALCEKTWTSITNYMDQDTDNLQDISNILPLANRSWHTFTEREKLDVKEFLQRICWNKNHPIGQLMDELNVVFRATYGGDLNCMHKLLLPLALCELKSIIIRFSQTLSYILPCLDPSLTDQQLQKPLDDDSYDSQAHCEKLVSDLIHPLVFDGMYCSIFSLYALSNDRQDQKFSTSIKLLNQRSDFALMNFYDVEPMFNPPRDKNQENSGCLYEGAVDALKQISSEKVPSRKMECVTRAFSSMIKTASKVSQRPECKMMMDSALPLLMFIIIRAATPYLSAELHFIEDFVDFAAYPEHEFVLHAVKAAFLFIISENQ